MVLLLLLVVACPKKVDEDRGARGPAIEVPAVPLTEAARPAAGAGLATADEALGGYPRFPDHHSGVVVFSAEGDLWQVAVSGGLARRLTTHEGQERFARFSPDGKLLAFAGDYDGNEDVFVMPAAGGVPRRITYHPSQDQPLGWTPDGKAILFRSKRDHPHGDWTLWTIASTGGDPVRLPLWRAARLAYEPGGQRVAINRMDRDFRHWKRYAGGTAAQIFVGDLQGGPFRKLTTFKGTNAMPMWHGGRIYFLSDRTGTANIWSMTPEGTHLKQHTHFDDYDVRFPALGDGKIVFHQRAELYLLDPAGGDPRKIPLRVLSDAPRSRVRFTDPAKYLTRFALAPDGKYLALQIRGNLHLVPAGKEGRRIRITSGSAARVRGLSFSDDGKRLAAVSDATGENELYLYDVRGAKPPRRLTRDGARFKRPPRWAPGGKLVAFADSDNRLFVVPTAGAQPQTPREVDRSTIGAISTYSWSPDGRFLAYSKLDDNHFRSIFVYDSVQKKVLRVTEPYFYDDEPRWSPDGKYLAFLSDRTYNPFLDRLDSEAIIDRSTKPYLVLLDAKTRSPFLPREPGEDRGQGKDKGAGGGEGKGKGKGKPKPVKVKLDVDGLSNRVVEVPVPAGNYSGLVMGKEAIFYLSFPTIGLAEMQEAWFSGKDFAAKLVRFDIDKKKAKPFLDEVVGFEISRDGKTIAVRRPKGKLFAFELGPKAPEAKELKDKLLALGVLREAIEPRQEWAQIFKETWRMMRDFYWTADMGKVDWKAMGEKYAKLLPRITTRLELEDLLGEMVAELSLGHTYIWGGDQRRAKPIPVGLLGADLAPHASGRYVFSRIYAGANWDPKRRSPLSLSHAMVREGEFLLAVDGRPLAVGDNVYSRLQKAAGQLVQLKVAASANGRGAREVSITTLRSERPLHYYDWVKHNRELVDKKTNGTVGYLHLPDMMTAGMVEFDRWYYPQVNKQGLIVDARWNRGGFVSEILVKRLGRKILAWWRSRPGRVATYPENTPLGPIVVLTNERAGSDGDIFPRVIQVAKLGPVIGTRTWGGVVGISLQNPLVDKGTSTRPRGAFWDLKRHWGVEGEGVYPDIVVDNDPAAVHRGVDAQLERGISEVLARIKKHPPRRPQFDKAPVDKRKKTWVDRYGQTDKP
jgi:tricorn protease